jgi:hypothetical protein
VAEDAADDGRVLDRGEQDHPTPAAGGRTSRTISLAMEPWRWRGACARSPIPAPSRCPACWSSHNAGAAPTDSITIERWQSHARDSDAQGSYHRAT